MVEVDHHPALIWIAFATHGDPPGLYVRRDLMLAARCIELASQYRLVSFHQAVMESIIEDKEDALVSLLKMSFVPKHERSRCLWILWMASDSADPFGPLTVPDLADLDGTGFLAQ
ncbi:hypothetical protein AC579_74 [Pseudocercospora musae]|uniref:Uncharacterized protein n=1 Tax=Pseudocercospora musae TaxID=113226 RepID=A0A139I2R7_9PEZI|nr:hypothetical protein AC579_74 [Pseudocercospora musae]